MPEAVHPPVAREDDLRRLRSELCGALESVADRIDGLERRTAGAEGLAEEIARLHQGVDALGASRRASESRLEDARQDALGMQAAFEERLAAVETRLAASPAEPQSPSPPPPVPLPFAAMLPVVTADLDLGDEVCQRLASAPSWEEFARRLVAEAIPLRTAPDILARIDGQLAVLSGQSVRLMIAAPGARPNPEEMERITGTRIERGVAGHVAALLRPGLRVDGRVVRRAEVEIGV